MRKQSIAIVEDRLEQADVIEQCVRKFPEDIDFEILRFSNADALAEHLLSGAPVDVCFMDIDLGVMDGFSNGIDAVKHLFPEGSTTQVVYVTGYANYHSAVYETEHAYLISKPIQQYEFDAALAKALHNLETRRSRPLAVVCSGKIIALSPHKIIYLESDRRKALIHTTEGVLETYAKLSDLARDLPMSFFQCHKSFLVNMSFIQELSARSLRLTTGGTLPVSRQRSATMRDVYLNFLRSRL